MDRKRILVVEDEESISFAMSRFLQNSGFEVDVASEYEEALALVANIDYDVVVADLRLTGVHGSEGLDLLRYVREYSPKTKTLLLTAYATDEIGGEARARGAEMVLKKPIPLPELRKVILYLSEGES